MRTPDFTQLTDLRAYALTLLQTDADLLEQLDTAKENICRAVVGYKAFAQNEEGIAVYVTEMPCLAIYPTKWEHATVHGRRGMVMDLGIQYLMRAPVGEQSHAMLERVTHWLNAVAWTLFRGLLCPDLTNARLYTGHVWRVHCDSFQAIPMTEGGFTGLDGAGQLETFQPPWAPDVLEDLTRVHTHYTTTQAQPSLAAESTTVTGTEPTP